MRTRLLPNSGKPLVLAEHPGNRGGRKTVLFYLHFDGQPVIPEQWAQKDPFRPVVKKRGEDGVWREFGTEELLRTDFDPEVRVFARSSADDKRPIAILLFDENLRMGSFVSGMRTTLGLLLTNYGE